MVEKDLSVIEKDSFFDKIKTFFKNLFGKKSVKTENFETITNNEIKKEKVKSPENNCDTEKKLLLIQKQIENTSLTVNEVNGIIKNLNKDEIELLKELYKNQIVNLERDLNNYKNRIMAVKGRI